MNHFQTALQEHLENLQPFKRHIILSVKLLQHIKARAPAVFDSRGGNKDPLTE